MSLARSLLAPEPHSPPVPGAAPRASPASTADGAEASAGATVSAGGDAPGTSPLRRKKRPNHTIAELQAQLRACRLQVQRELDSNCTQRVRILLLETHAACERLLRQLMAPPAVRRATSASAAGAPARGVGTGATPPRAPPSDEALCQQLAADLQNLTRFVKDRHGRTRRTCPLGPFVPVRALLERLVAARDARAAAEPAALAAAQQLRPPGVAELLAEYRRHVGAAAAAIERLEGAQGGFDLRTGLLPTAQTQLSQAVLDATAWMADAALLRPDMHPVLATCTADGDPRGAAPASVWDAVADRLGPLTDQQEAVLAAAAGVMRLEAAAKDRRRLRLGAAMAAAPWDFVLQWEGVQALTCWLHSCQASSCTWVLLFASLFDEQQLAVVMTGAAPWPPLLLPLCDALAGADAAPQTTSGAGEPQHDPSDSGAPSSSGAGAGPVAGGAGAPPYGGGSALFG